MPELPEVETIIRDLNKTIAGKRIVSFESSFTKAIKSNSLKEFQKLIVGGKIKNIRRTGKNITIDLDNGNSILIHLKMTGQLVIKKEKEKSKHLHHCFIFEKEVLCFYDIRKFGTLQALDSKKANEKFSALGVDPLLNSFNAEKLKQLLAKKPTKSIKSILMDQALIGGIGNIYASEILFDCEISPLKKAGQIKDKNIKKILNSIKNILRKAIKMRGTSISDYRDASGKKGLFQNMLKVYGKNRQKCPKCDTIIKKTTIEQRSTFYCPRCQK